MAKKFIHFLILFLGLGTPLYSQVPKAAMTFDQFKGSAPFTVQFSNGSLHAVSFLWDFGNGNFSSLKNPINIYTEPGTYTVKLVAIGSNGKRDSVIQTNAITVVNDPQSSFYCAQSTMCLTGNIFEFSNQSRDAKKYLWDFGDGHTSDEFEPQHSYSKAGKYTVKLIAYNDYGKSDLEVKLTYVNVLLPSSPDFQVDQNYSCDTEHTFQFKSEAVKANKWFWDFGDGTTSNHQHPHHQYSKAGDYAVKLRVNNDFACPDSLEKKHYIKVATDQTLDFSSNTAVTCTKTATTFKANIENAAIWHWDFGDSTFSTLEKPSHMYNSSGDYTVQLTLKDENGCEFSMSKPNMVKVQKNGTAGFKMLDTLGCSPVKISFANLSENTTEYTWDFGDGNTSSKNNPVHTFLSNGTFNVKMVAKNSLGCESSSSHEIKILPVIANFTADKTPSCAPLLVNFENLSQNATSYEWFFGDGHTSTDLNPKHSYELPGDYNVKLIAYNASGCSDTVVQNKFIQVRNTTANYTSPPTVTACLPFDAKFDNLTQDAVAWTWDFGDGTSSNQQSPTHTFAKPGLHQVSLLVELKDGCSQYYPVFRSYEFHEVNTKIQIEKSTCPNYQIKVQDLSKSTKLSSHWEFGDGTVSQLMNPTHQYDKEGHYTLTYKVQDLNGCNKSIKLSNAVHFEKCDNDQQQEVSGESIGAPVGEIPAEDSIVVLQPGSVPPVKQCVPFDVQFYNLAPQAASWHWDFGDGHTSTAKNPTHTYLDQGVYTVNLVALDSLGNSKKILYKDYIVAQGMSSNFSFQKLQSCDSAKFAFHDASSNATSWHWDFGDGHFSKEQNPIHEYQVSQNSYSVSLTTENEQGCSAKISGSVIYSENQPIVWAENYMACSQGATNFHCSAVSGVAYHWDFGDGGTAKELNTSHSYTKAGKYKATLSITNEQGCTNTYAIPNEIIVHDPQPAFVFTLDTACTNQQIAVTNLSQNTSLPLASHSQWNFGDGTAPVWGESPIHDYSKSGSYQVTLTVNHDSSCFASTTQTIKVSPAVNANFSYTKDQACLPITVSYSDSSKGAIAWFWEFGDGTTSTLQNPIHTFNEFPNKVVKLTIVGADSCTVSASKENIQPLLTDFSLSASNGCAPLSVEFTDKTNHVKQWFWEFGDGTTSRLQNPVHEYTEDGDYSVRLISGTSPSCLDTMEFTPVNVHAPKANFTAVNPKGCSPVVASFMDSSTNATTWSWDFGDGSTSEQAQPQHIYEVPGVYTISLIAKNGACHDTIVKKNYIEVPGSVADFTVEQGPYCLGNDIKFNDLSIQASSWNWYFGDGSASSEQSPKHTYTKEGTYLVSLEVADDHGCRSHYQMSSPIKVNPSPVAKFAVSDTIICLPAVLKLENLSQQATNYSWDFGNGLSASVQDTTVEYTEHGRYQISLVATNEYGCSDSSNLAEVTALKQVHADFSFSVSCPNYTTSFKPIHEKQEDYEYFWEFDQIGTVKEYDAALNFNEPRTLSASLTVKNKQGCQSVVRQNIVLEKREDNFINDAAIRVVTVASTSSIQVEWNASKAPDFSHYVLYRKDDLRNYYFPIQKISNRSSTSLIDDSLSTGQNSYCYKMRVFDHCDRAIAIDSVSSHCSIQVKAEAQEDQVEINWTPYVGAKGSHYAIYRQEEGSANRELIQKVPFDVLEFTDSSMQCPQKFTYTIQAEKLNNTSLQSKSDSTSAEVLFAYLADRKVDVVRSTVFEDHSVLTEWTPLSASIRALKGYAIYRSTDDVNYELLAETSPYANSYLDAEVDVHDQNYYYRVEAINYCNISSEQGKKSSSVLLSNEVQDGNNTLKWTEYEGWEEGVDYYQIQKLNKEGEWENVEEVPGTSLELD